MIASYKLGRNVLPFILEQGLIEYWNGLEVWTFGDEGKKLFDGIAPSSVEFEVINNEEPLNDGWWENIL